MKDCGIAKEKLIFSNHDLWTLIWPLLIEQLLQITIGMADIVMVSSLGESSVAGVSLVDQINILIQQIFAALATGGAVVCSQYIGRGDFKMASKTAKQLLYAISAIALFLFFTGEIFHRPLLSLIFGVVEDSVMEASQKYFLITLAALPSIALYNGAAALFRAQGNSRISMGTALLINIVNIGGNAIFIYGLSFGVEGVAIPTFLSRTAAALVLIFALYRSPSSSIKGISKIFFDWHLIGKILKIGIPNGLENSAFQIGKILVLSLIATYGTSAIAANTAANTITSLEVLCGNAIGLAMLTVIGQCMGAEKSDQATYYTKKLLLWTYIGFWLVNIPLLSGAYKILSFYNLSEEATRLSFIMAAFHGICGMFIWPIAFTLPNALRAANDASFTMIVSMVSMWTVRVGMSYVFKYTDLMGLRDLLGWPQSFGSMGVWIAMILDWVVRVVFFTCRFHGGKWKNHHLI